MSSLRLDELHEILTIMRQMQHAATQSDWQALTQLDDKRRNLIGYEPATSDTPSMASPGNLSPSVAAGVEPPSKQQQTLYREILELDRQIKTAVEAERQKLLSENRELSDQQKAKNGYAQASQNYS